MDTHKLLLTAILVRVREMGLAPDDLRVLCETCGVPYGAILPPIVGTFEVQTNAAGF